ncbi:unnamed protein product, partial [Owenia fusiformis]
FKTLGLYFFFKLEIISTKQKTVKMTLVKLLVYTCLHQLFVSSDVLAEESNISVAARFYDDLVQTFGDDGELNGEQLQRLLNALRWRGNSSHNRNTVQKIGCNLTDPTQNKFSCLHDKCLTAADLLALYNWDGTINSTEFPQFAPGLLYQATLQHCNHDIVDQETPSPHQYSEGEVWGYGLLCITAVVGSGLLGCLIFICVANPRIYDILLMAMVSLAIGVLTGMGLLFLIPEALMLSHHIETKEFYWKLSFVAGGLYFLFIFERIIKIVKHAKQKNHNPHDYKSVPSISSDNDIIFMPHGNGSSSAKLLESQSDYSIETKMTSITEVPKVKFTLDDVAEDKKLKKPKNLKHMQKKEIDTVAWVLVLGDILHNFVDGIAIGAGFSQSVLTGVGLSVCMICEHVPHKVGDFAILVNAGMSLKQAVLYTLLPGIMNYLGFAVGVVVGELANATTWILAFAGGIFLYIGLVDMLPEVSEKVDAEKTVKGQLKIFALQNLGILAGYSIMIIVALYASDISFE